MSPRLLRALVAMLLLAGSAQAQDVRLEFAGKPRLLECGGFGCFRMDVTALDARGEPVALDERGFTVTQGDQELPFVFARPLRASSASSTPGGAAGGSRSGAAGRSGPAPRRVFLVLFDTSGSMNEKLGAERKFVIAKRQLGRLFETFQEGTDRMAIAPFDSQRVAERIRDVKFETTIAALRRETDDLQPRPRGNTALFSAVREGLDVLKPFTREDAQVTLVVFTDGKNDVNHPSDDPDLLNGEAGLRTVTTLAREVGVTIYTIGYGAAGVSFDEASLQALKFPVNSSNYFSASDENRLVEIFKTIVKRGGTAVRLLVGPLRQRREQLSGQSIALHVTNGALSGDTPSWEGNPLMPPPFEGNLTSDERRAWIAWSSGPGKPTVIDTGMPPWVWRLLVLATYSLLLAGLWFGLPRLMWPDRYIPKPALRPAAQARAPQRPAHGRPAQQPPQPPRPQSARPQPAARPPQPARPEVTIANPRPAPPRPGSGADRGRENIAPPGRGREAPPAPGAPRPPAREPWTGQRDAGDATVFIPPSKKPGGQA